MEASFAMVVLKKKRAATVKASCSVKKVVILVFTLKIIIFVT